jgi:hypothetical protein
MTTQPEPLPRAGHRRPLWLGAVLAPLFAPLVLALLAAASEAGSAGDRQVQLFVEVFAFAFALGLPIAYVGMLLFGLPLVLWWRRRARLAASRVLLAAAPLGSVAMVLGLAALDARLGWGAQLGTGAVLGVALAAAFCLLSGIPWRADGAR